MDETQKKQKNKKKYILHLISGTAIVLVLLLAGVAFYYYKQYKKVSISNSESEIDSIVRVMSSVIELPQGELPTLATVTDKEKVKDQSFFVKAENGDKVLIYTNSKKAYLFRPSTNRVIDMTTLSEEKNQKQVEQPMATPTLQNQQEKDNVTQKENDEQQTKIKVAIYNGTTKKGITQTFEDFLEEKFVQTEVIAKETAVKQDYEKTLIIDVSGEQSKLVGEMAENLEGQLQELPEGEVAPEADVLIILGTDRL